MHISLISTAVKHSYTKHAYNKFTLTVKSVSFSLSLNYIINFWSYVPNYCYYMYSDITHPWHFVMTKFYCTKYTCADYWGGGDGFSPSGRYLMMWRKHSNRSFTSMMSSFWYFIRIFDGFGVLEMSEAESLMFWLEEVLKFKRYRVRYWKLDRT